MEPWLILFNFVFELLNSEKCWPFIVDIEAIDIEF
jgi:hypothetical protein